MPVKMSAEDLTEFMARAFPQVNEDFIIDAVGEMTLRLRMPIAHKHLRPGGTVSGPSMFALADCAIYLAVLAMIGPQALAVTTNCSLDFMRKPAADRDLVAECKLLKLGRVLAVGDVLIYSDGVAGPVARASMTYSIPPQR
ncbi:PaaI family thioesterase [Thalassobius sp. S69A]|uniref:PaaI family thioesterase n=1 Tax=unclassified Thalassovita TaxID=2619711 RepID=UPI000C112AEB|nr:thioesterase [Paracoccaceae bacterium]